MSNTHYPDTALLVKRVEVVVQLRRVTGQCEQDRDCFG
jgi:hypothetical protein